MLPDSTHVHYVTCQGMGIVLSHFTSTLWFQDHLELLYELANQPKSILQVKALRTKC